jgi:hypothetical protein
MRATTAKLARPDSRGLAGPSQGDVGLSL